MSEESKLKRKIKHEAKRKTKHLVDKEASKKIIEIADEILNYEKHAEKLIDKKIPKKYRHFARHALTAAKIAVGFVPGSHLLAYAHAAQETANIHRKQQEQANLVEDTNSTMTVKELRAVMKEAEKELKEYKVNQVERSITNRDALGFESELHKLTETENKVEMNQELLVEAIFNDLEKLVTNAKEVISSYYSIEEITKIHGNSTRVHSLKEVYEASLVVKLTIKEEMEHYEELNRLLMRVTHLSDEVGGRVLETIRSSTIQRANAFNGNLRIVYGANAKENHFNRPKNVRILDEEIEALKEIELDEVRFRECIKNCKRVINKHIARFAHLLKGLEKETNEEKLKEIIFEYFQADSTFIKSVIHRLTKENNLGADMSSMY